MAQLGLIDRSRLLQWADSTAARSDLPRLIRQLILETSTGIIRLGFPAEEGADTGGWDGTVDSTEITPFTPNGKSLWELSVRKDAKVKADEDYAKRLIAPEGSSTGDCSYFAVILRPWTSREKWEEEKNEDARWKEVKAYGVDDISTWLDTAPVTQAWLSERLGLEPYGIIPAENWWANWASATNPELPPAFILAGRDSQVEALRALINGHQSLISISGDSEQEISAFIAAFYASETQADGGRLLARSAWIDSLAAWRKLQLQEQSLVLVPVGDQLKAEANSNSPHTIIIPVVGPDNADIVLPPIDSQIASGILVSAGCDEKRSEEASKISRISLLAARRHLAVKQELLRPEWATNPINRNIRRILLIGRWNEKGKLDKNFVGKFTGNDYDDFHEVLNKLTRVEDPLIARTGSVVGLTSPLDAWRLIRNSLTGPDTERFNSAAIEVLTEPNPALELEPSERWLASIHGKDRLYSSDLREGIAITLELFGAHGSIEVAGTSLTLEDWASIAVRDILETANSDGSAHLWMSLDDVIPQLAEAAPDEFLKAVQTGLTGKDPLLSALFSDRDADPMFQTSYHTGLLWALERCAWSVDHFGQSTQVLARLAEIDPGGRLSNRPFNSLVMIFLPWQPNNSASTDGRLNAVDSLRKRYPDIAWQLMMNLLPRQHTFAMPTNAPRFRDWKIEVTPVTHVEYFGFIEDLADRILTDIGEDPSRWNQLIAEYAELPPISKTKVVERIDKIQAAKPPAALLDVIWESLRALTAKHREFPDANWSLASEELDKLESVAVDLEPTNPLVRHSWLFTEHSPDIADSTRRQEDFEKYDRHLAELRSAAAVEIVENSKWDEVQTFVEKSVVPEEFGRGVADLSKSSIEQIIVPLLISENHIVSRMAFGYVGTKFRSGGWGWLQPILDGDTSDVIRGALLAMTRDYPSAWIIADEFGQKSSESFWARFPTFGHGPKFDHLETAIERLFGVGRYADAIDMLTLYRRRTSDTDYVFLVANTLEKLQKVTELKVESRKIDAHDISELLKIIGDSDLDRERVAKLEWAFLGALKFEQAPVALHGYISDEPMMFVDIISKVYRPEGASDEKDGDSTGLDVNESISSDSSQATNAQKLISTWRKIPGHLEDGKFDESQLRSWVESVRVKLLKLNRLVVGDIHIGQVFAYAPSDSDESWPCVPIRDLIEELQNTNIERGFRAQIINNRGVTSRGLYDGGDQERNLATQFRERSVKVADQWPRTAAVLRSIADGYERDARGNDGDSERLKRGLDS